MLKRLFKVIISSLRHNNEHTKTRISKNGQSNLKYNGITRIQLSTI